MTSARAWRAKLFGRAQWARVATSFLTHTIEIKCSKVSSLKSFLTHLLNAFCRSDWVKNSYPLLSCRVRQFFGVYELIIKKGERGEKERGKEKKGKEKERERREGGEEGWIEVSALARGLKRPSNKPFRVFIYSCMDTSQCSTRARESYWSCGDYRLYGSITIEIRLFNYFTCI